MLEIKKDSLILTKIHSLIDNFNGKYNTESDFNSLITNSNKSSIYYTINLNGEYKGLIGIEVISAMNEFKLGKLHFDLNEKEVFYQVLDLLLEFAIKDYYTVKIISQVRDTNNDSIELLENSLLILNRDLVIDDINYKEYKITKPMFLRK